MAAPLPEDPHTRTRLFSSNVNFATKNAKIVQKGICAKFR